MLCLFRSSASSLIFMISVLACSTSPTGTGEAPHPETASHPETANTVPGAGQPFSEAEPPEGEFLTAELSTIGWDRLSGSPVVLLRELESGQVLPIWIGMAEARAISFELHGVELPRPMTHDLMTHLLSTLDAKLEEVIVADLREGTYYGLLKLSVASDPRPRWVDTRPSDGLALALRTDATIKVARKLLEDLPDYQFMAPESPEQVVRALGLTVVAPSPELTREFSLPDRPGLVVIATSGEAKRRGLQRGDFIVSLDDQTPREPLDLLDAVENSSQASLSVTYWRAGEEATVELNLGALSRPTSKNVA